MSSLLSADLSAACNALGYLDVKSNKYYADENTLETVKDLIRYLRRDDENHDIRRQLGKTGVLQNDLLPLLKCYHEEKNFFDVLLRLIVNLTTPALILWNEQIPTEKTARNYFLQVEDHLKSYKEAFTDESVWGVLSTQLGKILEIEPIERGDERSLIIERLLILIRNILYVPPDVMENRPDNDASLHDQVLWALHQSGMLDLILYITSSPNENAYYSHILEILTFMLREQNASNLAQAALQRSQTEKIRDEAELLAIRHKEINDKKKKAKAFTGYRHSRFGGTFVLQSMKSISDNDLIFHKPLNKLDSLNFDVTKTKPKTPRNRLPVKGDSIERRSAFSIRLFLKEFCREFLNGGYNTLMYHVKDNLVRARAQNHDESFYLWAMRFFMEFNRSYKFEVKLVSETMSVQTFHYVQQQSEIYYDMMTSDKKKLKLWSRRLHLALLAYRELFMTLSAMDRSSDDTVKESAKVIKSNIFYVLEYREFILTLLVNYDELKMSDVYLKDLMETQHIFLKMLETFVGTNETVVVQSKSKKRNTKKHSKKAAKSDTLSRELNLDAMWDQASPQISVILESVNEFSTDIVPFDAASDIPIDDQKVEAMKNIQRKLRSADYEFAIGLLRAAREVWPENDSFGNSNMAPEEEFLALRDIFFADLGENIRPPIQKEDLQNEKEGNDDDDDDEEEEEETVRYNESNFKFEDFAKRLPHPKIVSACSLALKNFNINSAYTNHCIVKLLHRIAFDCKMFVMLFQLSMFRNFQRIFEAKDLPQHKQLVKFATYIVRQFTKVAEVNKKVFMEALFWKNSKECHDIEYGYTEMHAGKQTAQRAWAEEEEDELRRLFIEHQQSSNNSEEDVVDWVTSNLIDQSKTRRQVIKKLKELMLLIDYKGKKKSGKSKLPKIWTEEEEANLQELFEQFRESDDPLADVMDNMNVPRSKNRIVEKLLVMGLIRDKKEIVKKKRTNKHQQRNTKSYDSHNNSATSESEDDETSSKRSTSVLVGKSSKTKKTTKTTVKEHLPLPRVEIVKILTKIINEGEMRESLEWLKESFDDAIEDYEIGNNEGIPLVPVMDYAEMAMENAQFQQLLKAFGVCPPFDEQEVYWRIPSTVNPESLQIYNELLQQALNNALTLEIAEETLVENESSDDDDDVFDKLREMRQRNTAAVQQTEEIPALTSSSTSIAEIVTDNIQEPAKPEIEFSIKEFTLDDDDDDEPKKEILVPNGINSKKIFDSDSEDDADKDNTDKRSRSDSESDKPIAKRSRVLIESSEDEE